MICLDARHARAALKLQLNKSDAGDAYCLAQIVRTGWYKEVAVKSMDAHALRTLMVARSQLVSQRQTIANTIRGLVKTFGHIMRRGAYLGLTPRRWQSGEVDRQGGISRCGDAFLRGYLFEGATVLLSRFTKPSKLKDWGLALVARLGLRKAKVAVARKLAVLLHRIWVKQTTFVANPAAI